VLACAAATFSLAWPEADAAGGDFKQLGPAGRPKQVHANSNQESLNHDRHYSSQCPPGSSP
jgi:hypothetical protein